MVKEVRTTGERVSEVAQRMGVTPSTAYLWLKAAASPAPASRAPVFARVVRAKAMKTTASASRIVLEVGGAKLHIESDVDLALLRRVVAALSTPS